MRVSGLGKNEAGDCEWCTETSVTAISSARVSTSASEKQIR